MTALSNGFCADKFKRLRYFDGILIELYYASEGIMRLMAVYSRVLLYIHINVQLCHLLLNNSKFLFIKPKNIFTVLYFVLCLPVITIRSVRIFVV